MEIEPGSPERKKRLVAGIISVIIPGVGQLYRRRWLSGIFFLLFLASSILFFKTITATAGCSIWNGFNNWFFGDIFAWAVIWILNIVDAYKGPFEPTSPCDDACPAGMRPSKYIAFIGAEKIELAKRTIANVPFARILARVCTAPCENKCSRSGIDSSIAIRYLKRCIDIDNKDIPPLTIPKREIHRSVCIIGSGPCGLSCAYFLRKKGYSVTVLEKDSKAGGIMRTVIPEFKLPANIIEQEVERIRATGVNIRTGVEVGKDIFFDEIVREFNVVFIASGVQESRRLNIEGEKLQGVYYGFEFLKMVKLGHPATAVTGNYPNLGDKIIVIGCGNTGIDVAETALRLGSKSVKIYEKLSEENTQASKTSIERAKAEGIEFQFLTCPIKINGKNGKLSSVSFIKAPGTQIEEEVTSVIITVGQSTMPYFLPDAIDVTPLGIIFVDRKFTTRIPKIFAGGDVIDGKGTIVDAIGVGKKASYSIDKYLRCINARIEKWLELEVAGPGIIKVRDAAWLERKPRKRSVIEIKNTPLQAGNYQASLFNEFEQSPAKEDAICEAKRCIQCSYRFR